MTDGACNAGVPAFHLFLPQMRMTHDAIVERARTAESVGFEGIAFMDHLAPPLATDQDMWEATSIATWVLARTTTLQVGHLVLCDALRHPAVLAKQVTSLDHASGGRFELGIGWGSVPAELEEFGVGSTVARERVARLGETLRILRGLWSGEAVDHDGEHFTLVRALQRPVPTRRIPLTIGGVGDRTLALVREHADWWNVPVQDLDRIEDLRDRAGTARLSVQVTVAVLTSESERGDAEALLRRRFGDTAIAERALVGTPDELVDRFAELGERGVERVYAWFTDFAPPATLERFAPVVRSGA